MNWWCTNNAAISARGTSIPGCIKCTYWAPDWSIIDDKYKTIENGYTEGGYQYKLINCITDYNESVIMQIFPKENITRIIFDSGLSVELSNY